MDHDTGSGFTRHSWVARTRVEKARRNKSRQRGKQWTWSHGEWRTRQEEMRGVIEEQIGASGPPRDKHSWKKQTDRQTDRESAVFVDSALGRGAGASQTLEMSSADTGPLGAWPLCAGRQQTKYCEVTDKAESGRVSPPSPEINHLPHLIIPTLGDDWIFLVAFTKENEFGYDKQVFIGITYCLSRHFHWNWFGAVWEPPGVYVDRDVGGVHPSVRTDSLQKLEGTPAMSSVPQHTAAGPACIAVKLFFFLQTYFSLCLRQHRLQITACETKSIVQLRFGLICEDTIAWIIIIYHPRVQVLLQYPKNSTLACVEFVI